MRSRARSVAHALRSALAIPEHHRYGPDPSQAADLHVPRGEGPFPVAVLIHGGFWRRRYGKLVMRPVAADLVRRGWAAWNLEYRRLGEGRGGGGGWPTTFEDVAAGIDALADRGDPRLDLSRVAAVGHSSGGHLALWAAARAGARVPVTEVVALAPVTDLAAAGLFAEALVGGGPEEVPERYALVDPLRMAPPGVPVRLIHAAGDRTVPLGRSRSYVEAVSERGGDVTLNEAIRGGHRTMITPGSQAWRAATASLVAAAPVRG